MVVVGLILILGGLISAIAGIMLNFDPISVGMSYLSGRGTNPGTPWVAGGVAAVFFGIAVFVVDNFRNKKEKSDIQGGVRVISGIIAIIALGVILLAGGSLLIFIGVQLNNAFNHAWDLFISYLSVASVDSSSGALFIITGAIAGVIGICFMVIGILEAVKMTKHKTGL